MTNEIDIAAAQAAAQAFFDEMLQWELWSLEVWEDEEANDQRADKLKTIFERYLSDKALQRGQGRYDTLDFQEPSEFAEKITLAEDAGKGKVWIYVPAGIVGGRARYLMTNEGGQWKVETRESDIGNSGKWAKEPDI